MWKSSRLSNYAIGFTNLCIQFIEPENVAYLPDQKI